jgi:hypothetical protein
VPESLRSPRTDTARSIAPKLVKVRRGVAVLLGPAGPPGRLARCASRWDRTTRVSS